MIEVVGEGFPGGLDCLPTAGPHGELGLGRSSGGMDEGGRSGLTDVGQDLGDGFRVGEDRDEREGRLAGGTDQRKDLVDPSQQGRPPGGSGRGDIGCFRCWQLGLGGGRRDLWFGRRETVETGDLSGQRVVLLGPGGDQRPQGRVGGEDPVVAVAVDAGRREDFGEPVQKLQGREAQGGAAGGVGLGEQVEDLVGAAADEVKPFERKRRPGAIPNEPL